MNRTMIIYILGCILKTEGVLMALPCLVALIYQEKEGFAPGASPEYWQDEQRCFSGRIPRIADYDADCLYSGLFLSRKSGEKSSISHGRCKNRTSISPDSRHLCSFCCMDVSADESGCYDFVPAPRKANHQYVAANNRL